MKFFNLSEQQIMLGLQKQFGTAKNPVRLSWVRGRCLRAVFDQKNSLMLNKAEEYSFFVVCDYESPVFGQKMDIAIFPVEIDEELFVNGKTGVLFGQLPFEHIRATSKWVLPFDEGKLYSLVIDMNGAQVLIPSDWLETSFICKQMNELDKGKYHGCYAVVPRILGNLQRSDWNTDGVQANFILVWEVLTTTGGTVFRRHVELLFNKVWETGNQSTVLPIGHYQKAVKWMDIATIRFAEKKLHFAVDGWKFNQLGLAEYNRRG